MRRKLASVPALFALAALGTAACQKAAPPAPAPEAKPAVPAAAPAPTAPAEVAPVVTGPPIMWTLTRGNESIMLYGTIHTGGESFVSKHAWAALAAAKIFVMEADIENVDQAALAKRLMLPDDKSLKAMLTPKAWETLLAHKPALVPASSLEKMKPWAAAMTLLQSWLSGGTAVDLVLKARAVKQGATVEYLETADEQLSLVEQALDEKALEAFLADIDKAKGSLDELVDAYKRGDIAAIETLTANDPTMDAKARELLLDKRNRNWVPKLLDLAKRGNAFVAVGAGHLLGKNGVIALLEAEGFKATRAAE